MAASGSRSNQLSGIQIHGTAPTASPEFSGLTPMNTGGSSVSNNNAINITTATTKREPYLRNWFMTSSTSSPNTTTPTIGNQNPNISNTASVNASPAASSLNALSTTSDSSYQQMKPFQLHQQHQIVDLSSPSQSPVYNSSSSSSVPSTQQHHTSINTNLNKKISNNGEHSHNKQIINNNNKLLTNEQQERNELQQQQQQQPVPQQKQQQKSSRRTTSLLNLFMSNSQGNNKRFIIK